jgi:bifunctional ADP-heptose synthase (sugar kinase/adenylyltransferase)
LNAEERQVLQKSGAKIDIVPFTPGYSTSDLLARLTKTKK